MAAAISPRALQALIALGAAAVLALWWHSALAISGVGGWLTGAGEILGLLAGYGVVVLVLLMARVRPIERGVGADRLARWHTMGGRYVIGLISGHAIAIIWGYAVSAQTSPVQEVNILEQPSSTEHDLQIGQIAFPKLISETLAAQSSRIDAVSGATYTSGGYIKSLQSALDNGV